LMGNSSKQVPGAGCGNRREPEDRIYTEADLVTLSLAVTVDVRLVPIAEVGGASMGELNGVVCHVRCSVESGRNCT